MDSMSFKKKFSLYYEIGQLVRCVVAIENTMVEAELAEIEEINDDEGRVALRKVADGRFFNIEVHKLMLFDEIKCGYPCKLKFLDENK